MKNKKTDKKTGEKGCPAQNMLEIAERYDGIICDATKAHAMLFRKMAEDGVSPELICATMFVVHTALAQNVILATREAKSGKTRRGKK